MFQSWKFFFPNFILKLANIWQNRNVFFSFQFSLKGLYSEFLYKIDIPYLLCFFHSKFYFKGTDRLRKVVELSMQCSMDKFKDSFETYKTFWKSVNPEFELKVDVQNRIFGWIRFQNCFFLLNYIVDYALKLSNYTSWKRLYVSNVS